MKQSSALPIFLSLLTALSLSACGGGGGGSSSNTTSSTDPVESEITETLTITPSLGEISDAQSAATKTTVTVYDEQGPSGGNVLGESKLNNDGTASVEVTYNELKPAVVEVTAGSNTSYYDEASESRHSLPQGYKLHALAPSPSSTAVSPITEMAYQLALENELFPLSASAAKQVNEAMGQLFSGGAVGPRVAPGLIDQAPTTNSLDASDSNLQAAMLAALAKLGSSESRPAHDVLEALKQDSPSGWINGFAADGSSLTTPYPGQGDTSTFASEWRTAFRDYVSTYGDAELEERAFLTPLARNRFLSLTGLSGAEKIKQAADNFTGTVRFSDDNGSDWGTFPEGQTFSAKVRADGSIEVHQGNINTESTSPLPGWSTDVDDTEVKDFTGDPGARVVQVKVPTTNPDLERYFLMVNYWSDLDIFYLVEDDLTTDGRDRIAHVIHQTHQPWQNFFDDLQTMADNGVTLTQVVDKADSSRECNDYGLGASGGSYPQSLGVIYNQNNKDIYSIQPQQVRFARNGDQREMVFGQGAMIRHNTNSGRVDIVNFESSTSGPVKTWATTDSGVISKYCDS